MTRDEAERLCEKLSEEHPDRTTHRWVPHEAEAGNWNVAKIGLAPPAGRETLSQETRGEEKPPTPDDPRPLVDPRTMG